MYRTIPCDGQCFTCPYPDCIADYTSMGRTPFEIEQAALVKAKKAEARRRAGEERQRQKAVARAYSRWLKRNHIRRDNEDEV
nr:hypothetical protein [uncultured Gemmiger sp.]